MFYQERRISSSWKQGCQRFRKVRRAESRKLCCRIFEFRSGFYQAEVFYEELYSIEERFCLRLNGFVVCRLREVVISSCERQLLPCHCAVQPTYVMRLCVPRVAAAPDSILATHGEKCEKSSNECKGNANSDDDASNRAG